MIINRAIPEQQSSAFEDVDGKYQQGQSDTGEQSEYYVELRVIMAIGFGCCAELERTVRERIIIFLVESFLIFIFETFKTWKFEVLSRFQTVLAG